MIHIYTGNGKGKTTAALGLALRAIGAGKKVLLVQFLKDGTSSEIKTIKRIKHFTIKSFGRKGFLTKSSLTSRDFCLAVQAFCFVQQAIKSRRYDIIILDEVNLALDLGLLKVNDLLTLIKPASLTIEFVLTGRQAPSSVIQAADLVTEMREIKHYFHKGVSARKGIEY